MSRKRVDINSDWLLRVRAALDGKPVRMDNYSNIQTNSV